MSEAQPAPEQLRPRDRKRGRRGPTVFAKPRAKAKPRPVPNVDGPEREVSDDSAMDALIALMAGQPAAATATPPPLTPLPRTDTVPLPVVATAPTTEDDAAPASARESEPEPESDADPEPGPEPGPDPDPEPGPEPESDPDPEPGPDSDPDSELDQAKPRRILSREVGFVLAFVLATLGLWVVSAATKPADAPAAAPAAAEPVAAPAAAERQPAQVAALAGARSRAFAATSTLRAAVERLDGFTDAAVLADVSLALAAVDAAVDAGDIAALGRATSDVLAATPGLVERAAVDADTRLAAASGADPQTSASAADAIGRVREAATAGSPAVGELFASMRVAVEAALASHAAAEALAAAEAEARAAAEAEAAAKAAADAAKAEEESKRPGRGQASVWNASTVYTAGDRVTYGGKTYEAQWWISGTEPKPSRYGPWILVD